MSSRSKKQVLYLYQGNRKYHLDTLKKGEAWFSRPTKFNDPFELGFQLDGIELYLLLEKESGSWSAKNTMKAWGLLQKTALSDSSLSLFCTDVHRLLNKSSIKKFLSPLRSGSTIEEGLRATYENLEVIEKIKTMLSRTLNERGIACLSSRSDSVLMWSHYANSHRGFCLELEDGSNKDMTSTSVVLQQVQYSNIRPTICLNELLFCYREPLRKIFATKSPDWSYEQEWRYITSESIPKNGKALNLASFSTLKRIIVGAKANTRTRNALISIAGDLGVPCAFSYLSDSEFRVVV